MNGISIVKNIIYTMGIFLLFGFHSMVFQPSGTIAQQQHKLIFISFLTMLIVVIPVIFMTLLFVYSYRSSQKNIYRPNWKHSNIIEVTVWIVPIIIVIFLSLLTWRTSHTLDPKRNITSIHQPIKIHAIALDWKWLFIYPKEKIATINELIVPVNTPIIFSITSNSVMSSFFIPELGSQVYAMPKMISHVNLLAKYPGQFYGFSANYNGEGFSDMKFNTLVVPNKKIFNKFINKIQHVSYKLNTIHKLSILCRPSLINDVQYFSHVYPNILKSFMLRSM
ncbi:ubiquinol oxidase subunit II [Buchnera aphidicola]|uniref:ubiquinol oxidase subunit II n=1 Tax=Buchnera aphidicola TaxID=9 RepID=UPI003464A566